jgi:hypothetical protein
MSFYTATNAAPRPERSNVLPAGRYRCAITASAKKPTKAGTGHYIELEFTVLEGEHTNRKVWERLNLWNPNAEAVKIAREAMDELLYVLGRTSLNSEADLIGATVVVKLGVRQNKTTKEPEQRIDKYETDAGPGALPAAVKAAAANTKTAVPAWAQKSA